MQRLYRSRLLGVLRALTATSILIILIACGGGDSSTQSSSSTPTQQTVGVPTPTPVSTAGRIECDPLVKNACLNEPVKEFITNFAQAYVSGSSSRTDAYDYTTTTYKNAHAKAVFTQEMQARFAAQGASIYSPGQFEVLYWNQHLNRWTIHFKSQKAATTTNTPIDVYLDVLYSPSDKGISQICTNSQAN